MYIYLSITTSHLMPVESPALKFFDPVVVEKNNRPPGVFLRLTVCCSLG